MEFRKGILFVRLIGNLSDKNCFEVEDALKEVIVEKGVKYVVLNLENVRISTINAYNLIIKYNSFIRINQGSLIIVANYIKMPDFLNIKAADNELQAMNLMAI